MKRVFSVCLFLLLSTSTGNCATTFFPPLQPMDAVNPVQSYNNGVTSLTDPFVNSGNRTVTTYPAINQIERNLFGRSFTTQNISVRLSRIEKSLFRTTYPDATDTQRIDNIVSNFNQINKYPNLSQNVLSRLEERIFNQNFAQNSAERRIERLEQQIFGAVQSGDLNSRYEALQMAAKSYNKNIVNNDPFSTNSFSQGGWKSIAGNIGSSLLGGSMTGFTPPINPFYNNYNRYGNYGNPYMNGTGMYQGYRSNHGYSDRFTNYGTGTGVTILD